MFSAAPAHANHGAVAPRGRHMTIQHDHSSTRQHPAKAEARSRRKSKQRARGAAHVAQTIKPPISLLRAQDCASCEDTAIGFTRRTAHIHTAHTDAYAHGDICTCAFVFVPTPCRDSLSLLAIAVTTCHTAARAGPVSRMTHQDITQNGMESAGRSVRSSRSAAAQPSLKAARSTAFTPRSCTNWLRIVTSFRIRRTTPSGSG